MVPRKVAEEAAHDTRERPTLPESMVRVTDVLPLFTMNTSVTLTIHFGNIVMRFGATLSL